MRSAAQRRALALAIGTLGTGITGLLDYVTGYEIRLFPLYFMPVAWTAWRHSRGAALVLACLSAVVWAASNFAAGRVYSSPWVWPINVFSQLAAFVSVAWLVAELQRRLLAEREVSRVDALTGLPNRRAFQERAELLLAVARRSAKPVTLAYLDLDNFKHVNDAHGHAQGDRALCLLAEVLKTHFRSSDLVARIGGDEFVAFLFDADASAAHVTLERMRTRIAEIMRSEGWPVSATIGATAFDVAPEELTSAIVEADRLMYRAKQAGKDRVHVELAVEGPAGGATVGG